MKSKVWFLAAWDIRQSKLPMLGTGLLYAFAGLYTGVMLMDSAQTGAVDRVFKQLTGEWVMLAMLSSLGFVFTKEYFNYYKKNAFTRRLAYFRKLPITNREIVAARYMVFSVTLPFMSIMFYLPFYLMIHYGGGITLQQFLGALPIWLGISVLLGAAFLHLELGVSGRKYLVITMISMLIVLLLLIALGMAGIHLYSGSLYLSEHYKLWPGLLLLPVSMLLAWLIAKRTVRRLDKRDLI